jgi:RNA polymerase sigma factor (sigma-70 family)
VIGQDDAVAVIRAYRAGDASAADRLIRGTIPMIVWASKRLNMTPSEDAGSTGMRIIWSCVRSYDPDYVSSKTGKTVKWSSFVGRALLRSLKLLTDREIDRGIIDAKFGEQRGLLDIAATVTESTEAMLSRKEDIAAIRRLLETFPDIERKVIDRRYFSSRFVTLKEVGRELGISKQFASVVESTAIRKLRRRATSENAA